MILDNIDLFSTLTKEEKNHISYFFQEYTLKKWNILLHPNDILNTVYLLLNWQIVISNENGNWLWFINTNSIIWVSILYDYSKKEKRSPVEMKAFQDCHWLLIPSNIIQKLTDKDRIIFKKVIEQIKEEKRIF